MSSDRKKYGRLLTRPTRFPKPFRAWGLQAGAFSGRRFGNEFGSAIFGLLNVSQNIMRSEFFYESFEIQ